jgi:hypothetical protein
MLMRAALQAAVSEPTRAAPILGSVPELAVASGEPLSDDDSGDEFICGDCAATFTTKLVMMGHRVGAHGLSKTGQLRAYLRGSICPAYTIDFRTRLRCLHHLNQGNVHCRDYVLSGVLPLLSAEELAEADREDREHRRSVAPPGSHELHAAAPCRQSVMG